jgi:hypothetical protein
MWPEEEDREIVFNMILLHEESRDEDNAKWPLPYLFHHQTCLIHVHHLFPHPLYLLGSLIFLPFPLQLTHPPPPYLDHQL